MYINYYYDLAGDYSSDNEGSLVQLCSDCAEDAGDTVEFASRGDEECVCEVCDAEQK